MGSELAVVSTDGESEGVDSLENGRHFGEELFAC